MSLKEDVRRTNEAIGRDISSGKMSQNAEGKLVRNDWFVAVGALALYGFLRGRRII